MGANVWPRAILHFDLDAFFAAVEQLERPELRGLPVVVGGDPGGRGVVATASYEARRFGVRSAMPARQARQLCPQAIFVRPRMDLYLGYSHRVQEIVRGNSRPVAQVSVDEGYCDLSASPDPISEAQAVKSAISAQTGLTASIGLSTSKLASKVASDSQKPDGFVVVEPGYEAQFLAPLPVKSIPGVGPKTALKLEIVGVKLVGDLVAAPLEYLAAVVGQHYAEELKRKALGQDDSEIVVNRSVKSVSTETTFQEDVFERNVLWNQLQQQVVRCLESLAAKGLLARTIGIKLRFSDFHTVTRERTLPEATNDPAAILEVVAELMRLHWSPTRRPLRLIGVRLAGLNQPAWFQQLRLFR